MIGCVAGGGENFPNDPFVQAKVLMHKHLPEDRAKWIENFRRARLTIRSEFAGGAGFGEGGRRQRSVGGNQRGARKSLTITPRRDSGRRGRYLLAGRSISEAKRSDRPRSVAAFGALKEAV